MRILAQTTAPRLLRYASGNLGKSSLASMMEVYALFYCTEALGIAPQIAGIMILASLAWDALVDPIVGFWADRQLAIRPSIARLLFLGMPVTAISFLLFFHLHLFSPDVRILLVVPVLIVFRAAYSLIDVPHNSLLVLAASSSDERKLLASFRILFSAVGKICLTAAAAYFLSFEAVVASSAMASSSLTMTLIFLATFGVCAASVKGVTLPSRGDSVDWKPMASLRKLIRSAPNLKSAFLLTAINSATIPAVGVALIYGGEKELGNAEIGASALLVQAILQAVMPLVWNHFSRGRVTVINLLMLAYIGLFSLCIAVMALPLTNMSLFALAAGSGLLMAGIFMLSWVYFSDALAAAKPELETDITVGVFGLYSIVNKVCHGFAQAMSGAILALTLSSTSRIIPPLSTGELVPALLSLVLAGSLVAVILTARLGSK